MENKEVINRYIEDYFRDLNELITFESQEILEHNMQVDTNVNYIKLFRLIENVINTLSYIDRKIKDSIFLTYYEQTKAILEVYHNFNKIEKSKHNIEYRDFLLFLKKESKYDESIKYEDTPDLRDEFDYQFTNKYAEVKIELRSILNLKCFYIDKRLWANAKNSTAIIEHFKNLNISKKNINLKTYLRIYLKKIPLTGLKDDSWHTFLLKTLKEL
jgi:hypothetical protein